MKKLRYGILLILSVFCFILHAQSFDGRRWLADIDNSRLVSSLSIPGAHDAATGEGLLFFGGFGKTQTLKLAAMWDSGVRAFDLRPAYDRDELGIYHGTIRTKVTFREALDILSSKLDENPTEFAIVLIREESEAEKNSGRQKWPKAVGEHIEALGSKAAVFKPGMTVGDLRGKILFVTRNAYTGTDKGAVISGWTHDDKGTSDARITSYSNGESVRLQVQDYYAPTDDEKRHAKCTAVLNFITLAGKAPKDVWTINFLCGYCTKWMGVTPVATTSGYKHNAAALHPILIDFISKRNKASLGIMFMDFAGADKVKGGISHWSDFATSGGRLVQLIIEQNL
jgi:hypothetical protein